jgi:uncharacterized protein (DUF4213/DUF364 family)
LWDTSRLYPGFGNMQKNSGSLKKTETGGDVGEDESNALIPLADVAAITGTAFTNYTIEHLLGPCNRDAYVLILGNTTPPVSSAF